MGHYSFGFGALLDRGAPLISGATYGTAPASSSPSGTISAGDLAHIRDNVAAQQEQVRVGSTVRDRSGIDTSRFNLLAPIRTYSGGGINVSMTDSAAGALPGSIGSKAARGGSDGSGGGPSTGGAGAPPPGGGSLPVNNAGAFAAACQTQLGGTVVGPNVCQTPDGAQITVGPDGKAVCANSVGQCAPAGGAGGKMSPMIRGAAALAALMFLK